MSSFRVSVLAAAILLCGGFLGVAQLSQEAAVSVSPVAVGDDTGSSVALALPTTTGGPRRRLQVAAGERPVIYTYYEQPTQYDPNDDSLDLIENWRKAWFDMGWNPIILSPQQAQMLPQYEQLMTLIPSEDLITPEAIRNYKRWMAMAYVGGGWLADFQLWPLNYFLRHGRALPYDGALTVYMGTNPVLVSGTGEEYLRLARQIGQTADKMIGHQKWLNENYPESYQKSVLWNDSIALMELRKNISKDMFKVRGDVVDKGRLQDKDGIFDCAVSEGKRGIFFRALKAKSPENRGSTARKFLNGW
eukprot:CAMPEP_0119011034 /NCGR_PEP_ID=MMETSP1176-20130426/5409_1 /TAXON_ID=265551 /ORGANISM="Synedropsis recta cf, Strain CCMP1620" /LENGTH=303 /DNA_ID=CAMNT_0006963793 /DNA_START=64 /DNA_END=972 /DNA_ORIENTATION=-